MSSETTSIVIPTGFRNGGKDSALMDQLAPDADIIIPGSSPKNYHRSSLRRNVSYGLLPAANKTEAKILVIYTGGTIGMVRNANNGK